MWIFSKRKNFINPVDPFKATVRDEDRQARESVIQQKESDIKNPISIQDLEDSRDLEVPLPKPKIHRSGTVSVQLHFLGRGKPLPFDESSYSSV